VHAVPLDCVHLHAMPAVGGQVVAAVCLAALVDGALLCAHQVGVLLPSSLHTSSSAEVMAVVVDALDYCYLCISSGAMPRAQSADGASHWGHATSIVNLQGTGARRVPA
jgi:hypothetical protein